MSTDVVFVPSPPVQIAIAPSQLTVSIYHFNTGLLFYLICLIAFSTGVAVTVLLYVLKKCRYRAPVRSADNSAAPALVFHSRWHDVESFRLERFRNSALQFRGDGEVEGAAPAEDSKSLAVMMPGEKFPTYYAATTVVVVTRSEPEVSLSKRDDRGKELEADA